MISDTHFKILIADTVVEIISNYDCVHEFCADYLTDKETDFIIRISRQDIEYERLRDDKSTGSGSGRIPSDYPDSYLEVLACYRKIAEKMIKRDTLLMHGAAVSIDGNGIMFIAESGTGKSTHARLWAEQFKNRVKIINDDKPLVKITGTEIFVCGTPWSGKKGLNTPIDVPLKTIYKIERSSDHNAQFEEKPVIHIDNNYVFELSNNEKWKALASQSYKSPDPLNLSRGIELADMIMQHVPIKKLVCDISNEAVQAAYEGVFGGSIT